MNTAAKGRSREKSVMKILVDAGWCPIDSRGSHGIDIRAWDGGTRYLAIAVGGKGKNVLKELLQLSSALMKWAAHNPKVMNQAIPLVARLRGRTWQWFEPSRPDQPAEDLAQAIAVSRRRLTIQSGRCRCGHSLKMHSAGGCRAPNPRYPGWLGLWLPTRRQRRRYGLTIFCPCQVPG